VTLQTHNPVDVVSKSGAEKLVHATRYDVLVSHTESYHLRSRNCTPLRRLAMASPYLLLTPSAAEMLPLLPNTLFLTLRIALAEDETKC
jgi:hypothetical protein